MQELFKTYKEFVDKNKDKSPKIGQVPIIRQNRFQYVGGQFSGTKLYGVVNSAEAMICYDTVTRRVGFEGSFPPDDFKWTGGCIYDGVFYSFPRTKNSLLAFDIKNGSFEEIPCTFTYEQEHHYGGVCTENGVIYQPPRNSNHILKWDIKKRICEKITINNGEACRYCGSVLHPGGYIYFIPENGLCVLKMDIKTEEIIPIGEPLLGFAFDMKIAYDGNIYGFRSGDRTCGIIKIDTKTDTVSVLHENVLFGAYSTKPGINGKLYSLPGYTKDVWEFNPETQEIRIVHTMNSDKDIYYAGGAVDKNGNIYGLPVFAEDILTLQFDGDEEIPENVYKTFFTDCY